MTTNQQQNDEWQDCPSGEMSQLVKRLNSKQKRVQSAQLLKAATVCILLVAAGVFFTGSMLDSQPILDSQEPKYGGITCSQCKLHFASYRDHKTAAAPMEEALATSMATHLKDCNICRSFFEKTYPGVLSAEHTQRFALPVFAIARPVVAY